MKVYTIQLSKWRLIKNTRTTIINTTVKSGIKAFAPSWDIVMGVKNGDITPEQYTEVYLQMLESSLITSPEDWETLLEYEDIAFSCYCPKGNFCHRYVLAKFYSELREKNGSPIELAGEIG